MPMIVFLSIGYMSYMTDSVLDSELAPLTREDLLVHTGQVWPAPAGGHTRERWHLIRDVAREDLALVKVVEPHHDAVAILAELDAESTESGQIWAVWAAEPPFAVLVAHQRDGLWSLSGRKAFCSGAGLATHALVTATSDDGARLFAVDLGQPGVAQVDGFEWVGTGMKRSDTAMIRFDDVHATAIGEPGSYTHRTGFWWGGVGIAAAWFGGALGLADRMEAAGSDLDPHGLAHLGAVRADLDTFQMTLDNAATCADEQLLDLLQVERLAQSVRARAAQLVGSVVEHVGVALGPGPLAYELHHSARVADIQVFVRQHHGEKDLARLGSLEAH